MKCTTNLMKFQRFDIGTKSTIRDLLYHYRLDLERYISFSGNLKLYAFPICHHPVGQSLDFLLNYEYTL